MSTKKPHAVKSVAEAVSAVEALPQGSQYKSAAALLEAAAPATPGSVATQFRQVMRDAGKKVGRGKRYDTITPKLWLTTYKQVQADKTRRKDTAKAAKAKAPAKETAKATA